MRYNSYLQMHPYKMFNISPSWEKICFLLNFKCLPFIKSISEINMISDGIKNGDALQIVSEILH